MIPILRACSRRMYFVKPSRNFHISSLPNDLRALSSIGKLMLGEQVQHALAYKQPVVALESAIITHGLPRGDNLTTATELEAIVRHNGAVPATIAVMDGVIRVGLTEAELTRLAEDEQSVKLSKRDLPSALSLALTGGTTCAATMFIANRCSINVFATGGLGGVHRGGECSFDISADLIELAHTPILLVSAGVKSILDIGRTLEYLETQGVNVVTYASTTDFPAFYVPKSGFKSPWNVGSPAQAASILSIQEALKPTGGTLLAVPIPAEFAIQGEKLQLCVDQAIEELRNQKNSIQGKEITPWLLRRVNELSKNASVNSNKSLIRHATKIASEVAVCYASLGSPAVIENKENTPLANPKLLVIGSAAVDITCKPDLNSKETLDARSTTPGSVALTFGGVARNIAEAAHRALVAQKGDKDAVMLISPVALDHFAELIMANMETIGLRADGMLKNALSQRPSASCVMLLDREGELRNGVADMGIASALQYHQIASLLKNSVPKLVVFDANLNSKMITDLVDSCSSNSINTLFEPTSLTKCTVVLPTFKKMASSTSKSQHIDFISPNILELQELAESITESGLEDSACWQDAVSSFQLDGRFIEDFDNFVSSQPVDSSFILERDLLPLTIKLLPFVKNVIVKCGAKGTVIISRDTKGNGITRSLRPFMWKRSGILISLYPPPTVLSSERIHNVIGAGDSFVGILAAGLSQNIKVLQDPVTAEKLVHAAQTASVYSLESSGAVSPKVSQLRM